MAKKKTSVKSSSSLIEVGKTAPAFNLPDQNGDSHQLKDYRDKWVVLYFYPKDNTSGCTDETCQFRDDFPRFKRAKAIIWGMSPDNVASHLKFATKFKLPFDLLADDQSKICTNYGVWQQKSMYGRKYMGVVRTTYLINPKGKVAARWDKVKVKGHAQDVLSTLKELAK
jgi:peroxiredoxin Q/BCP